MQYQPVFSNAMDMAGALGPFPTSVPVGDPIWIVGAWDYVTFQIEVRGSAANFRAFLFIESNSGPVSVDGIPDPNHWIVQFSPAQLVSVGPHVFDKRIPVSGKPAWRTRVVRAAGNFRRCISLIPYMRTKDGQYISAGRPPGSSDTSLAAA